MEFNKLAKLEMLGGQPDDKQEDLSIAFWIDEEGNSIVDEQDNFIVFRKSNG